MPKVIDLRSALELLEGIPGQLVQTDVEVDPTAELSGVYRHVGAGGTVKRPTQEGPAMIFNNIKGHKDAKVVIADNMSPVQIEEVSSLIIFCMTVRVSNTNT